MQRTAARGMLGCLLLLGLVGCSAGAGHHGVATGMVSETVSVFYATDRAAVSREPDKVKYGWRRQYFEGQSYELGVCRVEIKRERNHDKAGPLPRSSRELVSLVSTSTLDRDRFYNRLREMMWYAGANETFVFIHGFNNGFEDAARRTAEIWYDVGFEGPPVMFSWPSRGGSFWRGVFGYFADSETMKWSAAHLKAFLLELVGETNKQKMFSSEPARIHLIAHSMGCRTMVRALMQVADDLRQAPRPIFCDVILAAPDIDRDLFRDVIVLKLLRSRLAEHYTLYASSADKVIKTSGTLQIYPRAGNAGDGLVAVAHQDFDTIDASAVGGRSLSLNHDYFVTEPRLIRDLIEILKKGNRDPGSQGRFMRLRGELPGEPWVLLGDEGPVPLAAVEGN